MGRNFKLIFNELLSILILINVLILISLTLDFDFNLESSMFGLAKLDLIVSFLIIIHTLFRLSKKNKIHYLHQNWSDMLIIIPLAHMESINHVR